MTDFSEYKSLEASRVGATSSIANAAAPVAQSHTHEDRYYIANLSAALAESPVGLSKYRANLIGATLHFNLPFVSNGTDYNILSISKRTGAGATVLMGNVTFLSVAGTAFVGVPLTLVSNSANTQLAAGDLITVTNAKTGNGVANTPVASLTFVFEDT